MKNLRPKEYRLVFIDTITLSDFDDEGGFEIFENFIFGSQWGTRGGVPIYYFVNVNHLVQLWRKYQSMYGDEEDSLCRSSFYFHFNDKFKSVYRFHRPINDCCSDCLVLGELIKKCKNSKVNTIC